MINDIVLGTDKGKSKAKRRKVDGYADETSSTKNREISKDI